MKTKNILIISSHADDHISCAGTIFKLQEEQGMVSFELVLTDSSLGQDFRAKKPSTKKEVALMRQAELSKASKFLGIKKTFLLNQPDMGLQINPDILFAVAKIIREIEPEIVFINGEYDGHPDHRTASRIGLDAIKIAAMNIKTQELGSAFRVPKILCVEQMLPDRIQILVDITQFKDKKDQLLAIYASQMSPKSLAFEQGMMAVRGYHLRKNNSFFAEAFTLQNEFPILFFEGGI